MYSWGEAGAKLPEMTVLAQANLSQTVACSSDSCSYKNLSTVEVGLQMVCQSFDLHSPTLNTPQPYCFCSGLLCSLAASTVQQLPHHFWLVFVCTISPLIPNAITNVPIVRASTAIQFVCVLKLVRCNTTQCGFESRSRFSLYRSHQSPISFISL